MKEQILISNHCRTTWDSQVNFHLKNGWSVVPGTIAITCSIANHGVNNAFVIVLERAQVIPENVTVTSIK